jgi:tetraacyldisaccharide 4'-kinase
MKRGAQIRWALLPLTVPYGLATYLRSAAYNHGILQPRRLSGTVICVGNLTTGGTGKTPLVELIAGRLASEGKKVGILTRGYRGANAPDGAATSDEVQLLQTHLGTGVAFGVGADRYASGRKLVEQGVEWFVMDDGFQHRQLYRDANVLVIDATAPFGGGRLLPAGALREPKSAMARADMIVITRSAYAPGTEAEIRRYSPAPVFYAHAELESVASLQGAGADKASTPSAARYFAFCGIGNPQAFLDDLRRWSFNLAGHKFFRDHHRYTAADAATIETEARESGAGEIVCTEKDAFNLRGVTWAQYRPVYTRIAMRIDRADEFWSTLMDVIEPAGTKS